MTISSQGVIAIYTGSGSVGPFSLVDADANPILFNQDSDIQVFVFPPDSSGRHGQGKTINTDYTLTGAGSSSPGSVTLSQALTSGYILSILRREPLTQELDLFFGGDISLDQLEAVLDEHTRQLQEMRMHIDRSMFFDYATPRDPISRFNKLPTPAASKFWQWADDASEVNFVDVNLLRAGTDVPSDSLGLDGDFFFDTVHSKLYGPKTSGHWGGGLSIVGPTGPTGATGSTGPAGQTVLNGSGAPSNSLGNNGDFYIDTAFNIYGPKAGGVWPGAHSLIGPSGAGTGDVVGPSSATDTAISVFSGTTGKLVKNSSVTISATGTVAGALWTSVGVKIGDNDSSNYLTIQNNTSQNADRSLGIDVNNANRTISLSGNLTVSANSALGGTAYVVGGTDVPITDGGTGASDAATAFSNLKQAATTTQSGVFEIATDAEIRSAATGTLAIMPSQIESVSAAVALTDAATVSLDWDTGINFTVTIAGNRTLDVPNNAQPGTWRTIKVNGDGATARTLNYAAGYRGGETAKADITSSKEYLLSLFSITSSVCILHSAQALP